MNMKNLITILICALSVSFASAQADSAAYYHQKGLDEKQARRYREAEKHFLKAIQLAPGKSESLVELGFVLIEQRRYREAREQFVQAEKQGVKDPAVIEQLATLSLNMRMWKDAIAYAQKMEKGKGANLIMAKSYYGLENYGETIKYCELAFKEEPQRAEIPYIAARAFVDMNNYKRAAGCFEQAIERDSSNATWMYEAGLTYYAVPDDKKAIYWFERAAAKG